MPAGVTFVTEEHFLFRGSSEGNFEVRQRFEKKTAAPNARGPPSKLKLRSRDCVCIADT